MHNLDNSFTTSLNLNIGEKCAVKLLKIGKIDAKKFTVIMVIIAFLILLPISLSAGIVSSANATQTLKTESIEKIQATIISVDNYTIIVDVNGEIREFFARGRWLIIANEITKAFWIKAKEYVREGEALIITTSIIKEKETLNVLLGLKQDNTILIRPILLKYYVKRYMHTRTYMSVKGQIIDKKENYFLIEKEGFKGLVAVGGTWLKSEEEVTWDDVAEEFKIGDTVRVFCHNILIMNDEFAEIFGINAFIWGYSGAIADLTSGIVISKI